MAITYNINELNRFTNLKCGKIVPHRIMYNKKVVKFLAKGGEMLPEDTLKCTARWQPGYDKILPSQIYGNWFNYQYFDTSNYSTVAIQNEVKWLFNYSKRRTLESRIILPNLRYQDIVLLINGNTVNSVVKHPHLDISQNANYDKYRAMQYANYTYSNQIFNCYNLTSPYEVEYRDVHHLSGYSVHRDFLNNVNGFSISFTVHLVSLLKSDSQTPVNPGPLTFLSMRILGSQYQTYETLTLSSNYHAADVTLNTSNAYPTKYVFANIVNGNTQTKIDPNGPYVQVRLKTDINENKNMTIVDNLNCKAVDGFAAYNTNIALANAELYPNVTITLTCDKKVIKIYMNGNLYSSRSIEALMNDDGQFYDIDVLMERNLTFNSDGEITSQSVTGSPYTKLYNLHVFSECLSTEQVQTVFQASKKYLSTAYYYRYEEKDHPASVIAGIEPSGPYQAPMNPIETFQAETYYGVLYAATAHSDSIGDYAVMTRVENITNDIMWEFDSTDCFIMGGSTIAHASFYKPGYPSFSKDYTITVKHPSET